MKGTERQVAWAEDIKKSYETAWDKYINGDPMTTGEAGRRMLSRLLSTNLRDKKDEMLADLKEKRAEDRRRWIANGRDKEERHLMMQEYKAAKKPILESFDKWVKEQYDVAMQNDDARFWIDHRL